MSKSYAMHNKDGYKADHRSQYPQGTTLVYSNMTPRGSRVEGSNEVVVFGIQYFCQEYLIKSFNDTFFNINKDEAVGRYKRMLDNYLGPDAVDVTHVADLHDLGYLPVHVKALPEGTLCPTKVPLCTIVNTKPEFFWLTNMLETILSTTIWMPMTSATTAYRFRKLMERYADLTSSDHGFIDFQCHDFSMRGMAGLEAAQLSGAGHLTSFVGTDTIPAIDFLYDHYKAEGEGRVGASVSATEHSVASLNIENNIGVNSSDRTEAEYNLIERLTTEVYPDGIVSLVSDTFDFWRVVTDLLPRLKDKIMARDGKVVIRPDSGDPVKIICGDPEASEECVRKGLVECLWDTFGGTMTAGGYMLLDSHIGAIYGDSITYERAEQILEKLRMKSFASSNIVFGIGSYTYTGNISTDVSVTRDTYNFAMKATYGEVNGIGREIFKDPKTDDGTKKSAKGLIQVYEHEGVLKVKDQCTWDEEAEGLLETVFYDGKMIKTHTLTEIRQRLRNS